jgi:hypothetical protein
MIAYDFTSTQNLAGKLSAITSALESALGLTLHTPAQPPDPPGTSSTSTTYVSGSVGLSFDGTAWHIHVVIFTDPSDWPGVQIAGVKYVAQAPATIPSQSEVQNAIGGYL